MFNQDDIVNVESDNPTILDTEKECVSCAAHYPAPQSTGNLQVDPEIRLPSPGMDVDISYYYNSWDKSITCYGFGRTISANLILIASGQPRSVRVVRGNGASVIYKEQEPGKFVSQGNPNRLKLVINEKSGEWIETNGKGVKTVYPVVAEGKISKVSYIEDSIGNRHTFSYNKEGVLSNLTDAVGRDIVFHYGKDNLLCEIVDWAGRKTTFAYDTETNPKKPVLTKVIGPTGCQTVYRHDKEGLLTAIVDPNGYETTYVYDKNGRVICRSVAGGAQTKYEYDYSHIADKKQYVRSITDGLGNKSTEIFDDKNRLISKTSPMGVVKSVGRNTETRTHANFLNGQAIESKIHDEAGNVVAKIDQTGLKTIYTYDQFNNRTSTTFPSGNVTKHIWGFPDSDFDKTGVKHRLQVEIDEYGNKTSYTYNKLGLLTSTTDPHGSVTKFEYDEYGNLVSKTNSEGARWSWKYDAAGNAIETTNPDGGITKVEYDTRNRPVKVTDPVGVVKQAAYDGNGNKIVEIDEFGNRWKWEYNVWDKVSAATTPMGHVTKTQYNAIGLAVAHTDSLGNTSRIEYDADGNTIANIDALGNRMEYKFDNEGRRIATIDALRNRTQIVYDKFGRVVAEIDAEGNRTTLVYDELGRRVARIDALGNKIQTGYNDQGRFIVKIDKIGNKTEFVYDSLGRIVATIDPMGNKTQTVYDENGDVLKNIDALGREFKNPYKYDSIGRLISASDPYGNLTKFEYDLAGRRTTVIDALSNKNSVVYDLSGRIIATIDALGAKTSYAFDSDGHLIAETNPLGHVTRFEYDAAGHRIAVIDANGIKTTLRHNAIGIVIEEIDGKGNSTKYEYDAVGNPVQIRYADGRWTKRKYDRVGNEIRRDSSDGGWYEFTYDPARNVLTETDSLGKKVNEYDNAGRLIRTTLANGKALSYKYDANGNRIKMVDHEAGVTKYGYDAVGRMAVVANPIDEITRFEYDDANHKKITHHANGVVTAILTDVLSRETKREEMGPNGNLLASYHLTYDASGNRTTVSELDGSVTHYNYDLLGQLISEHRTGGSNTWNIAYEYDLMGNRLIKNENGEITKYEYGPCNELLAEIPQNGAATRYEYDDCGRLISETKENQITKRQWDAESRLTAIHAPDGKTETSLYNSDGLRIAKMSEDKKYFYVWDGQNVLAETDDSGNSTALWTHANKQWGTMISERRGEKSYTFGFDPLSNTRVLTNANGAIVETFNYDAFGVNKATAESIIPTPFQYGGEQGCWRDGANMYYVRARHLNVASGRWISRDPLGFAGRDLNLYRFVNNAPVLLLDPSGAFHCTNYKTCTLLATGVDIKDKKVQTLITCMINAGGSTNEMYKCIAAYGKSVATTSLCNYVGCIAATNETGTVMHSGNVYCDTCTSTCGSTTYCSECCDEKYYQAACNCAVKSASLSDFGDCMITPLKNKANCETNCPN